MILQRMSGGTGGKAVKIVLLGFLFMAVAGLVLADVQGFFRGGMQTDTIAKGGGIRIATQDFDRTVRRVLAAQGMSAQDAYRLGLIDQILESEIQSLLLTKEATDLGLVISDDVVKGQIAKLAEPLTQAGRSKGEALAQVLRSQGISENEFIRSVRQEMAIGLLRNALISGSGAVSDDLAQALYQSDKETRSIEAVILNPSTVKGVEKPTTEQLKTYYDANKMDYATPESRTATLAFLSEENLKDSVKLTDAELEAAYKQNIETYQKPAQREVEQSVFADQAAAEKAFKDVSAGKSLKDASGDSYLGKNAFGESGLMPEIAKPVFSGKAGDVIGPVQTALGWHVLIVGKDIAGSTTPFAEVKESLRKEMAQTHLMDAMIATANEIDDRLAGGDKLETLVTEYGLTTQKIGPFRQTGFNGAKKNLFESYGTDSAALIDAAFEYEAGEVAPIVEMADGRYAIVRVEEVTPIAYKSFEEVESELAAKWTGEQRALMNRARAQDALAAAEKGGTLSDIAAKNNGQFQTFKSVGRTDSDNKSISPVALAKIFSTDKGGALLAESDQAIVLVRVTGVTLPQGKASAAELKEIKDRVAREQAQESLMQYVMNRSANSTVKINAPLLKQLYGEQG